MVRRQRAHALSRGEGERADARAGRLREERRDRAQREHDRDAQAHDRQRVDPVHGALQRRPRRKSPCRSPRCRASSPRKPGYGFAFASPQDPAASLPPPPRRASRRRPRPPKEGGNGTAKRKRAARTCRSSSSVASSRRGAPRSGDRRQVPADARGRQRRRCVFNGWSKEGRGREQPARGPAKRGSTASASRRSRPTTPTLRIQRLEQGRPRSRAAGEGPREAGIDSASRCSRPTTPALRIQRLEQGRPRSREAGPSPTGKMAPLPA